MNNYKTLPRCR